MNNAIYADPGQNLCLTQQLEFALVAFHTNLFIRLNLMHLSEVIISAKKYRHLKKMIFYIARKIVVQKLWIQIVIMPWVYTKRIGQQDMFQQSFQELFHRETNEVKVAVDGKRRRELGLVVPDIMQEQRVNER